MDKMTVIEDSPQQPLPTVKLEKDEVSDLGDDLDKLRISNGTIDKNPPPSSPDITVKLEHLNIKEETPVEEEGDDERLIERSPTGPSSPKPKPKKKQYQITVIPTDLKANHYTLPLHNSGGAFVDTTRWEPDKLRCPECARVRDEDYRCVRCLLDIKLEFGMEQQAQVPGGVMSYNITEPESPQTRIQSAPIAAGPRRDSYDSGLESDMASPQSLIATSPPPPPIMMSPPSQPNATPPRPSLVIVSSARLQSSHETKAAAFRKILPKPTGDTEPSPPTTIIVKTGNRRGRPKGSTGAKGKPVGSASDRMKSSMQMDAAQRRQIWLEVVKMPDAEVFEVDGNGDTCLHRVLGWPGPGEDTLVEWFYAYMEKLKRYPMKCEQIIRTELSICDAIQTSQHRQLLLDYFQEAVQLIRERM